MVEQNQSNGVRGHLGGELLSHDSGQVEPGHDVRDDHHQVAVDFAHPLRAVGRVGDGQQRVRVRVVHKRIWQQSVQDGLDGRRRRGWISQSRAQFLHHLHVREPLECCQA